MRVRFAEEARRAAREKRAWWSQHREKAPRLFVEELGAVVAKVREGADQGRQQYAVRAGRIIWRLLMPKTRIHVYYRFEANGDVEVISVWNATGSAGPTI